MSAVYHPFIRVIIRTRKHEEKSDSTLMAKTVVSCRQDYSINGVYHLFAEQLT